MCLLCRIVHDGDGSLRFRHEIGLSGKSLHDDQIRRCGAFGHIHVVEIVFTRPENVEHFYPLAAENPG